MNQQIFGTFSSTKFHEKESVGSRVLSCIQAHCMFAKASKESLKEIVDTTVFIWLQLGSNEHFVYTWC
jgi:hypothetical protein